jgi:diadenosine tetraphosphate (Ap4A) HIT family hydrolase
MRLVYQRISAIFSKQQQHPLHQHYTYITTRISSRINLNGSISSPCCCCTLLWLRSSSVTTDGSTLVPIASQQQKQQQQQQRSFKTLVTRDTTIVTRDRRSDTMNTARAIDDTNKVKVLFLGCMKDIDSVNQSVVKIQQLYSSKKTFDIAFTSITSMNALQYIQKIYADNHKHYTSTSHQKHANVSMPIHLPRLYLQDNSITSSYVTSQTLNAAPTVSNEETKDDTIDHQDKQQTYNSCYQIQPNLFVLRQPNTLDATANHDPASGIWEIPIQPSDTNTKGTYIVVASIAPYYRNDANNTGGSENNLQSIIQHPSYIGCDILLSTEWPQGMEIIHQQQQPIIPASDPYTNPINPTISSSKITLQTSFDVADVALKSRPRYHISIQQQQDGNHYLQYYQSPPFAHMTSTVSTRKTFPHTGRFIALCPVSLSPPSAGPTISKIQKYLHAISIVPLHEMSNSDISSEKVLLPNPYTDVLYPIDQQQHQQRAGNTNLNATSGGRYSHERQQHEAPYSFGLSEAAARRIIAEETNKGTSQQQIDQFRWSINKNTKRTRSSDEEQEVIDPNNCTLFLYGLQQDRSGRLQKAIRNNIPNNPNVILQALQTFHIEKVRYPKRTNPTLPITSNYAFLDFPSHVDAATCLQAYSGRSLEILGIPLSLKWATPQIPNRVLPPPASTTKSIQPLVIDPSSLPPEAKKLNLGLKRLTEQEAHDSCTLYFKYTLWKNATSCDMEEVSTEIDVNRIAQKRKNDQQEGTVSILPTVDVAGEIFRKWMERTLEVALTDGDVVIRSVDEPALQVTLRLPKIGTTADGDEGEDNRKNESLLSPFGFLHFASHAAASMAIATLTGSTNGGRILEEQRKLFLQKLEQEKEQLEEKQDEALPLSTTNDYSLLSPDIGMYLHWANDYVQPVLPREEWNVLVSEDSGFKFERKHFPKDSRKDCWFCLASPCCEKHLITGVYDSCYITLPKGPIHPGHVLIVPVQHTSQGALKDPIVAQEMETIKAKLRQHASIVYNSDLFVFERAIQTRGGYHTHVQCVPIPRALGLNLQKTLLTQGRKFGMDIREINTDLGVQGLWSSASDESDGGYFYAEIPMLGRDCKRFIYKVKHSMPTVNGRDRSGVNMQFGREILALVLEDPKVAHWKSCEVDQDQEAAMALTFRESFEQSLITL